MSFPVFSLHIQNIYIMYIIHQPSLYPIETVSCIPGLEPTYMNGFFNLCIPESPYNSTATEGALLCRLWKGFCSETWIVSAS